MEEVMSAELVENLVDFCENRARVYALLSRCYEKELDTAFAAELAEAARVESDDPALAEGFAALQADLAGCDDGQLELLAVVFDRVFFGMGPRSAQKAFPYESVYTSAERLLMQRSRDEVLAAYRAQGFERSGDLNVPEDHAGIELAFMARLCRKEADALAAGDEVGAEAARETQRVFLRDHVLAWFPQLCADLEKRAKRGLYRGLAETVRQFLAFEREELGVG